MDFFPWIVQDRQVDPAVVDPSVDLLRLLDEDDGFDGVLDITRDMYNIVYCIIYFIYLLFRV
jgi:hypothetical protein